MMRLVITGGHHSSALPVIKKLKKDYPNVEIFWVGHKYSLKNDKNPTLEYKEITALDIPFYELKAGKIYHTYDLGRLLKVPLGVIHSLVLLMKLKPDLILSFGGYLAAPVVVSGYMLGIPSITHEQTLVAGYANKLIAKFAKTVMISWEESAKYFPKNKTKFVGIPLRESIFTISSNSFDSSNNLPYLYITTGKSGSVIVNKLIGDCLEDLLGICNIIHQCGDYSEYNSYEILQKTYEKIKDKVSGKLFLRKFVLENEVGEAYNRADLVFARSGAHTVSELLALNKPALLMPIPWVSHNEQYENAYMLRDKGLAQIVDENTADSKLIFNRIKDMFEDHKQTPIKKNTLNLEVYVNRPVDLIINEIIRYNKKN